MIDNILLHFNSPEEEIEIGRDILCLVSSWGEIPYFLICNRKLRGICNSFDAKILDEHTQLLKWAYLPEITE